MGNQQIQAKDARIQVISGVPMATSLAIAEHFEKSHFHVLRDIEIVKQKYTDQYEWVKTNFIQGFHSDKYGRSQPIYRLTEFAFMTVAMGFTGEKAAQWQWAYAQKFLQMREALQKRLADQLNEWRLDNQQLEMELRNAKAELKIARWHEQDAKLSLDEQREKYIKAVAENSQLRVENYLTDQLLTDGQSPDVTLNDVMLLKESFGEFVHNCSLKDSAHAKEMAELKRSRETVDARRAECFEMYFLIQTAFDGRMVEASLIWALLCLQATVENFHVPMLGTEHADRTFANPKPWMGRSVSLTQVIDLVGHMHTRRSLWAAADRLETQGVVVIQDRADHGERSNQYRVHLMATLRRLKANRDKGDWVGAQGGVRASWLGTSVTLPNPDELIPPQMLINSENPHARYYVQPQPDYKLVITDPQAGIAPVAPPAISSPDGSTETPKPKTDGDSADVV